MEKYTYSEFWEFEAKLVEAVKESEITTEMVIEQECGVRIRHTFKSVIEYYGKKYLADVMTLSADKSIINSNSKYYIMYDEYFECTNDLMEVYGDDFDQTIYDMWGNGEQIPFEHLYSTYTADNWRICYINNAPSELDVKIINALVANRELDLLAELAKERAWAIYWD